MKGISKKSFFALVAALAGGVFTSTVAEANSFSFGIGACTSSEEWKFSKRVKPSWIASFDDFKTGRVRPIVGLAESLAMQDTAKSEEAKLFAVYWKNRALFEQNLIHIAVNGFNWIAKQKVNKRTIGIQTAAIECLNQVYYRYPRIHLDPDVVERLPEYKRYYGRLSWAGGNKYVLWDAAGILFRVQLSEERPDAEIKQTLKFLRGSGIYYNLTRGLWESKKSKHRNAIKYLERFFNAKDMPENLKRYQDAANIALARSYYMRKRFKKAAATLQKVQKDSNHMVRVLSELAWVQLMAGEYPKAVGTALNFQVGGFQRTFAPDAIMILAMALNELCHYPSSLKSVQFLRKNYKPAYQWLRKWYLGRQKAKNKSRDNVELYKAVITKIEKGRADTPARVLSEWMRSPVFISHQEELNILIDERLAAKDLKKQLREEYRRLKAEMIEMSNDLRERKSEIKQKVASAKRQERLRSRYKKKKGKKRRKLKPIKVKLDDDLKEQIIVLKRLKLQLARLRKAVKPVEKIKVTYGKQAPEIRKKLVERIGADIAIRNARMLKKLKELAENTYLVEVEIYNGASEDVVWQNAHPEFSEFLDELKADREKAIANKVYNWGPPPVNAEGFTEIWQDELGTMLANVEDKCSNKDKFLAVKFDPRKKLAQAEESPDEMVIQGSE